jgi:hypothetical protein
MTNVEQSVNENWQGKPKYPEKTCPSAVLSTTNTRHMAWAQTHTTAVGCRKVFKDLRFPSVLSSLVVTMYCVCCNALKYCMCRSLFGSCLRMLSLQHLSFIYRINLNTRRLPTFPVRKPGKLFLTKSYTSLSSDN